jgi:DNA-binding FrmR family transcriptional regulator
MWQARETSDRVRRIQEASRNMADRTSFAVSLQDEDMTGTDGYDRDALVRRLNRIEGQVRGIRRMIEESRSCLEVLQQLAAAEAALDRIGLAIFRHHVDHCVRDGLAKGEGETRRQLNELVDIFDRFGK